MIRCYLGHACFTSTIGTMALKETNKCNNRTKYEHQESLNIKNCNIITKLTMIIV